MYEKESKRLVYCEKYWLYNMQPKQISGTCKYFNNDVEGKCVKSSYLSHDCVYCGVIYRLSNVESALSKMTGIVRGRHKRFSDLCKEKQFGD